MTQLTRTDRINREIDRLKRSGVTRFCPADIGKVTKTDARTVTVNIRDRTDVYQIARATGGRQGYRHSLWGIRQEGVEA